MTQLYTNLITRGLLAQPHTFISELTAIGGRIAIITDEVIAKLFGENLNKSLRASGLEAHLFTFPAGEQFKTRQTKEMIENQLFERGFGRDSCIVALGGGVVTDLAGFIAATYCRGVPLVMIPTTLLAMVDASLGGKNGVNVPYGKNLIGTIYQPKMICIDPDTLTMLPKREFRSGVVEMVKHGLIADVDYFTFLEGNIETTLSLDPGIVDQAIRESCRIKLEIVCQDENEEGIRHLLNAGHTVGHALEKLSNYAMTHGEAVAIGIVVECRMAMQMGYLDAGSFERIKALLINFGLPFQLKGEYQPQKILDVMSYDKKSIKRQPRFVILEKIGLPLSFQGAFCTTIDEHVVLKALNWMNDDLCSH